MKGFENMNGLPLCFFRMEDSGNFFIFKLFGCVINYPYLRRYEKHIKL